MRLNKHIKEKIIQALVNKQIKLLIDERAALEQEFDKEGRKLIRALVKLAEPMIAKKEALVKTLVKFNETASTKLHTGGSISTRYHFCLCNSDNSWHRYFDTKNPVSWEYMTTSIQLKGKKWGSKVKHYKQLKQLICNEQDLSREKASMALAGINTSKQLEERWPLGYEFALATGAFTLEHYPVVAIDQISINTYFQLP